jgi:hypothetical protein
MTKYYLEFDDDLKFLMSRVGGYIENIRDWGGTDLDPAVAQAIALALKSRLDNAKTEKSELA